MICPNCGKSVDDNISVCPFCGALIDNVDTEPDTRPAEDEPLSVDIPSREPVRMVYEEPVRTGTQAPANTGKSVLGLPALILSLLSFVLSLLCLTTVLSLRGTVREMNQSLKGSVDAVGASLDAVNARLDQLDTTLAGVQAEAYDQVASQSITLTKDLTPLTGPVDEGKYNQIFIVKAKGNLNVDTSFDWQKYNEATGGWVSVVFTGDATTNEQYGLRLENQYSQAESEYTTILWAQGITPDAAGSYRCVITDASGITKTSSEATIEITPAE